MRADAFGGALGVQVELERGYQVIAQAGQRRFGARHDVSP